MLASDSQIPCFVRFLFVKRQPPGNYFQLLTRQRSGQELTINRNSRFIFTVIHMNMWFIMLSYIVKQQINHHSTKAA